MRLKTCLRIRWRNKAGLIYRDLYVKSFRQPQRKKGFFCWLKPMYQSFPYENHCECCKKLIQRSWFVLFALIYFFSHAYTLLFFWKIKSCCYRSFPQQIRLQTTVQLYILRDCSSVSIGFSMNNKRHTLHTVYTMLV